MPKPYSYDLRKKAIEAIEQDGMKKSEVSQLFNISRNTIDLWLKRYKLRCSPKREEQVNFDNRLSQLINQAKSRGQRSTGELHEL
jgi:transposase